MQVYAGRPPFLALRRWLIIESGLKASIQLAGGSPGEGVKLQAESGAVWTCSSLTCCSAHANDVFHGKIQDSRSLKQTQSVFPPVSLFV